MLPVESQELESVFSRTYVQASHCMAITAASRGEGVSTLILSLARRHIIAGRKVLIVDLNLINQSLVKSLAVPSTPWEGFWMAGSRQVFQPKEEKGLAILPAPSDINQLVKLREPGVLQKAVAEWKKYYDVVLLDTPPLNNLNASAISSPTICAASDSVILTVLAGHTTDTMVSIAVKKLIEVDARLVGTVINDRYNPVLKDELLLGLKRFETALPGLTGWLAKRIQCSRLLSLEV